MLPNQRFPALDIFRGMTLCFMIIVNTGGNGATTYPPLMHAHWNGFTPTDLVFPSFMFAVGNAMTFSLRKWEGLTEAAVFGRIFKRALIIFLLGYLMYWFPFVHYNDQRQLVANPFSHTRVMGVLQRIALGYFFGSLIVRYFKINTVFVISLILLLVYWLILLMGGDQNDPYNMLTNAGTRLDLAVLGPNHLYHGEGVAFDPEGILSTMPAIANVTFGYFAGKWIQTKGDTFEGLAKLLLAGVVSIAIALCWDWFFPVNKKLWTGSFVLLTVGIDCCILACIIYVTAFLKRVKWGYFFVVFGRNPLFIYLLSELGATLLWFFTIGKERESSYSWIYHNVFEKTGAYFGSFLFAVSFMMVCWLVAYILNKRKIYVRV